MGLLISTHRTFLLLVQLELIFGLALWVGWNHNYGQHVGLDWDTKSNLSQMIFFHWTFINKLLLLHRRTDTYTCHYKWTTGEGGLSHCDRRSNQSSHAFYHFFFFFLFLNILSRTSYSVFLLILPVFITVYFFSGSVKLPPLLTSVAFNSGYCETKVGESIETHCTILLPL